MKNYDLTRAIASEANAYKAQKPDSSNAVDNSSVPYEDTDNCDDRENYDLTRFGLSNEELFERIDISGIAAEHIDAPEYSYWRSVLKQFFSRKLNTVLLGILVVVFVFSFIYPMFISFDRFENVMVGEAKHLSASRAIARYGFNIKWLFGTGSNGESVFDSVWTSARISLSLALISTVINVVIGTVIGLFWGYVSRIDGLLMQLYYTIGNVPYVLIVAVILMIFNPGFGTMIFAFTVTGWLEIAYDVRTQVMIQKGMEYNTASKSLGSSDAKIVFQNILPHLISVLATVTAMEVPVYISLEVFFSYIGIGLTDMSLGRLIYEAEHTMFIAGWSHEFWFPVAVACIVTGVFYVIGQHFGDAADPKKHYK